MNRTENGSHKGTAVALGLFDGVHLGHQAVVRAAVGLAREDGLVPAVFTFTMGRSAPESKGGIAYISTEEAKEEALRGLGVREIFRPGFDQFRGLTGEEFFIRMLCGRYGARALCCGGDFRFGRGAGWGVDELEALCREHGVKLCIVPAVQDGGEAVSSTRIRALLREGRIEDVNRLLGRRYGFDFEVVHGRRLGRTISAPTINQPFLQGMALPRFGVYAALARVDGGLYPAVTNIGVKPTVKDDNIPLAETWIQGDHGDLYGKRVPVSLLRFLRPEIKFESIDALREAIHSDMERAMRVCGENSRLR